MPRRVNKRIRNVKRRVRKSHGVGYTLSKAIGSKIHYFHRQAPAAYIYSTGTVGSITLDTLNPTGGFVAPLNMYLGTPVGDRITGCAQVGIGLIFRLSDVINYNEFAVLFDQYCIRGVKMKIELICNNQVDAQNANVGALPEIWTMTDFDDGNPPSDIFVAQQYESLKRSKLEQSRTTSRTVVPRVAEYVYKTSGVTAGYAQGKSNKWLDCTNVDIDHYGMKFFLTDYPAQYGYAPAIRVTFDYFLAFKNVR